MKTLEIYIMPDGTICAVNNDALPLDTCGHVTTRRASHVLPCNPFKRAMFKALRALFGEHGRVADFCRNWRCRWQVSFAEEPGRVVFTHDERAECITWEVQQLNNRFALGKYALN